jgi:uncharacterized damage-inducible protein DinB
MSVSPLSDAFAHHIWATQRLLDASADLTPEQLEQDAPGTYGPIVATLHHLVETDRWYLRFFPSGQALPPIAEEDRLTIAELRSVMGVNGEGWTQLLESGVDPDEDIVASGEDWEFHAPVGLRLAQVLHHGSDHRSQVCTALTSLGVTPPEIDLWAYGEATGRTRDVVTKQ